jgi:hypothetical protein
MNDETLVGLQFGGEFTVSASDMNNQPPLNTSGLQDVIRLIAGSGHHRAEGNKHNTRPQYQSVVFHDLPLCIIIELCRTLDLPPRLTTA